MQRRAGERGVSLVEMTVVVACIIVLAAIAAPSVRAYSARAQVLAAGQKFRTEFFKARTEAIFSGRQTAIRFESCPEGTCYSVYRDGEMDGISSEDIRRGIDYRVAGPFPLTAGLTGVRVGINPGVPQIPPERGMLGGDPIRFGVSRMISFTPLGGATPGTFYLAGDSFQAAVRVTGSTSRVRLMIWTGAWREASL
jgi:type II secretory pathway pseudopilin PulG